MMGDPLLSVVIPVFDGERFIGAALASVLGQEYEPLEVIVVDDGSHDATDAVVRAHPEVTFIRQDRGGPAAARNTGVRASRGELIAFLDADDLMPSGRLARQVEFFRTHPEVDCVLGRQQFLIEPGVTVPRWMETTPDWMAELPDGTRREQIPPMSMSVRRHLFDRVGFFDTRFRLAEDVDWLMRVWETPSVVHITDEVVLIRRVHGGNLTYDTDGLRRAMFAVLRARIDRKRSAP